LPLRQWLTFHGVADETEATCEALFPKADDQAETKVRFRVSLNDNSRLKRAEQIFSAMGGEQAIKKALQNGPYVGLGMQVALSQDQQTLLTQFIEGEILSYRYRSVFYDAKSKQQVTSRATRRIHTLAPLTSRFSPKLSVVSLSRTAWVNARWLPPIGRNLPGLGSVGERKSKTQSVGNE